MHRSRCSTAGELESLTRKEKDARGHPGRGHRLGGSARAPGRGPTRQDDANNSDRTLTHRWCVGPGEIDHRAALLRSARNDDRLGRRPRPVICFSLGSQRDSRYSDHMSQTLMRLITLFCLLQSFGLTYGQEGTPPGPTELPKEVRQVLADVSARFQTRCRFTMTPSPGQNHPRPEFLGKPPQRT